LEAEGRTVTIFYDQNDGFPIACFCAHFADSVLYFFRCIKIRKSFRCHYWKDSFYLCLYTELSSQWCLCHEL